MFKMTGVVLELNLDINMYLFVVKGIRGGIFYIAKRYNKPNNKYMKLYDDSKPNKHITYLEANNLYGWAMSQYLPYSGFKCLNKKEINRFDINLIIKISSHGYIVEVDIEYPHKLRSLHNDYPLVPEKLEIGSKLVLICCQGIVMILRFSIT